MLWSEEFVELLRDLIKKARLVHKAERGMTLQSIDLIYELHSRHATVVFDISQAKFAKILGVTKDVYEKRRRMGLLFEKFPETREMFLRGDTEISHLAVIAGKITEANCEVLLNGIKGKSKREVEAFASRVDYEGNVSAEKGYHDLNFRFSEDQCELLERAREVLAKGGKSISLAEILELALNDLLDKRDPMRKAERAQARAEKKASTLLNAPARNDGDEPQPVHEVQRIIETKAINSAPGRLDSSDEEMNKEGGGEVFSAEKPQRKPIPAAIAHAVRLRDAGQCTYVHADGSRCECRTSLQIDHIKMVCRGGENNLSNLRLLCLKHNLWEAERNLGSWFTEKKKEWSA